MAAALLLALLALVYGSYVAEGGFSTDDWSHAAAAERMDLAQLLAYYWDGLAYRPVDVVYLPLQHLLLGVNPGLHIAWTLLLACAASVLLYLVLRELRLAPQHAFALAALVLVFPHFDSIRLWPTANLTQLATAFCLAGLLVALRGLRAAGTAASVTAHHGGALLLYLLGIFSYEAVAPVVALLGGLYRTVVPWERVVRRWAADVVVAVAAVAWVAAKTPREPGSLGHQVDHAREIADQGLSLIARSALPFGDLERLVVLAALVAVVVAALLARRRLPADDERRQALGRWAATVIGGVVLAGAGWLMFVPAADHFVPGAPGLVNRTNAVAGVGVVVAVYACVVAGASLLALRAPSRVAQAVAAVAAAVLLVGYVREARGDVQLWTRASERAGEMLATLERAVGRPERGTRLYSFGAPGFEAPGVPIFIATWDLTGAVQLRWGDASLAAYPMLEGASIECTDAGVRPVGPGFSPAFAAPYGDAVFVDIPSGRGERIGDAAQCRAAAPRFAPGPLTR